MNFCICAHPLTTMQIKTQSILGTPEVSLLLPSSRIPQGSTSQTVGSFACCSVKNHDADCFLSSFCHYPLSFVLFSVALTTESVTCPICWICFFASCSYLFTWPTVPHISCKFEVNTKVLTRISFIFSPNDAPVTVLCTPHGIHSKDT